MNLKKYKLDCCFRMYYKLVFALVMAVVAVTSCVSSLYIPTTADATNYNVSLDTLQIGREVYLKSCGSCHNLYLPSIHTKQEWVKVVNEMQKPAKISNKQKELILNYLEISCKK